MLGLGSSAAFGLSGVLARAMIDAGWTAGATVTVRIALGAATMWRPLSSAPLPTRETTQRAELTEWLLEKGLGAKVAAGVVETLARTPGMKADVRSMATMG